MKTHTHVYLSPHLDDAVLSCGGRIWQQVQAGERALVVTIFAGVPSPDAPLSPFAQALHALWGLADAIAARREEDTAALALLQAEAVYWPYLDCIYRQAPDGSFFCDSEETLFGEVHPAEGALIAELAGRFRALTLEQGGTLYAPLAVGHHVDHQVVRRAVAGIEDVVYYEDYPYAEEPGALEAALGRKRSTSSPSPWPPHTGGGGIIPPSKGDEQPVASSKDGSPAVPPPEGGEAIPPPWWGRSGGGGHRVFSGQWRAELVALSPQALEAKIAAIACYGSQLEALGWADAAEMATAVRTFAQQTGDGPAERYWRHV